MYSYMSELLAEQGLYCHAPITLSSLRIVRPYLLERAGIREGTVIMIALPYYTPACDAKDRNVSAYAVARDYHLFFKNLFDTVLPKLTKRFPEHIFVGFADHSPIDERDAAARAGLGIIGENHMLITPRYSSYVFFGEIITDIHMNAPAKEIAYCEGCHMCTVSCPYLRGDSSECLSSLTQKKGVLTPEEEKLLLTYGCAWGCDICQQVCPHTKKALTDGSLYSNVPFFHEHTIPRLTAQALGDMGEEEFSQRAYSWRGLGPISRNLSLMEGVHEQGQTNSTPEEGA